MKFKYDKQTDILVIRLSREKPDFASQKGNIIAHYNKNHKPVEIEILDANRTTKQMLKTIQVQKAMA